MAQLYGEGGATLLKHLSDDSLLETKQLAYTSPSSLANTCHLEILKTSLMRNLIPENRCISNSRDSSYHLESLPIASESKGGSGKAGGISVPSPYPNKWSRRVYRELVTEPHTGVPTEGFFFNCLCQLTVHQENVATVGRGKSTPRAHPPPVYSGSISWLFKVVFSKVKM